MQASKLAMIVGERKSDSDGFVTTRGGKSKLGGGSSCGMMARGEEACFGARRAARLLSAGAAAVLLSACLALAACGGSGPRQKKTNAPPKSDFERSLDTVRRGSYVKIYVIRRTDGQPLSPEDRDYLRRNTPMETGMWVVTEDGRAAIAGANFEFEPKHFEALSKRFAVEDYTGR